MAFTRQISASPRVSRPGKDLQIPWGRHYGYLATFYRLSGLASP